MSSVHSGDSRKTPRHGTPAARVWLALLIANARYWSGVAPRVRKQLAHWTARAGTIPDPAHRVLALDKLRRERFNVELAATLATLAPRTHRALAVEAIVALQVAYDYLDALGERHDSGGPHYELALADAVSLDRPLLGHDDDYLRELIAAVKEALVRMPAAPAVAGTARCAAERCARAQMLGHGARSAGDEDLVRWATSAARPADLGWREWLAGAQASVLSLHALIVAAADARSTVQETRDLDALYLWIGALTMLDSLVDSREDATLGEAGYIRFYASAEQMGGSLAGVARAITGRAGALRHGSHHLMTLTGVVAYYASAPAASDAPARSVIEPVRDALQPALQPVLALMLSWRLAKRLSSAGSSNRCYNCC